MKAMYVITYFPIQNCFSFWFSNESFETMRSTRGQVEFPTPKPSNSWILSYFGDTCEWGKDLHFTVIVHASKLFYFLHAFSIWAIFDIANCTI